MKLRFPWSLPGGAAGAIRQGLANAEGRDFDCAFGSAVPTAFAADITVTADGVDFGDREPINRNGRVMVPVRAVAEKMGWIHRKRQ